MEKKQAPNVSERSPFETPLALEKQKRITSDLEERVLTEITDQSSPRISNHVPGVSNRQLAKLQR